jgi:hypothetical protein
MFKIGLTALIAAPLAFTSAKALDNAPAANAAAAFGQFGVAGLGVAGAAQAGLGVAGAAQAGQGYAPFGPPAYTPVCWTQYMRVGNAYNWVNWPYTICR